MRGSRQGNIFPRQSEVRLKLLVSCLLMTLGLFLYPAVSTCSANAPTSGPGPYLSVGLSFLCFNLLLLFLASVHNRHRLDREQRRLFDAVRGIAEVGGEEFFAGLVIRLCAFVGADYAHVSELTGSRDECIKSLAVCRDGHVADNIEIELAGTPCATAVQGHGATCLADLDRRFPDSPLVKSLRATVFLGCPVRNAAGQVVGVVAALGGKRLLRNRAAAVLLTFIAQYAAAELERNRSRRAMEYMAYHDPLTEMPNWRFFRERLAGALEQAQHRGALFGLIFLDVDRFKNVNQNFGHETGDLLLRFLAERLAAGLDDGGIISRKGGDRFFILLPHINAVEETGRVAERLLQLLREPFVVQGRESYLSISAGIVTYPADGADVATLLANVDAAMHRAKEMGGGCFQYYKPAMSTASRVRLGLEGGLRKALERGEFLLHYQPQYQIASHRMVGEDGLLQDRVSSRLVGAECLIRWRLPGRGMVPPMEFIPLAEETGLIEEVGGWVLETACAQLRLWHQRFGCGLKMSVNLSVRQLQNPDLVDRVAAILAKNGLPPEALCLEITESCLMANVQESQQQLQRLRTLGVGISIDDFGTGYSSLSYLRRFPVTALKIDRSFVRDICEHADHQAIVNNIVSMAKVLKLQVVAEGVETEPQLSCLYASGCRLVQGFLFNPPLSMADFTGLLDAAQGAIGPDL